MKIFNRTPKTNTTILYITHEIDGDTKSTVTDVIGADIDEDTAKFVIEMLWETANIKSIHLH